MGKIVATDRGEGRQSRRFAPCQRRDDIAGRGLRLFQRQEVGGKLRVILDQRASGRVELIAFFRDGERDDMGVGRCHGGDERLRRPGRDDDVLHRADDARLFRSAIAHQHGIKAVLRHHLVAHGRRTQRGRGDAPAQVACVQGVVKQHRLMRAVERADAQMDDSRLDLATVIIWANDVGGKRREHLARQAGHSL